MGRLNKLIGTRKANPADTLSPNPNNQADSTNDIALPNDAPSITKNTDTTNTLSLNSNTTTANTNPAITITTIVRNSDMNIRVNPEDRMDIVIVDESTLIKGMEGTATKSIHDKDKAWADDMEAIYAENVINEVPSHVAKSDLSDLALLNELGVDAATCDANASFEAAQDILFSGERKLGEERKAQAQRPTSQLDTDTATFAKQHLDALVVLKNDAQDNLDLLRLIGANCFCIRTGALVSTINNNIMDSYAMLHSPDDQYRFTLPQLTTTVHPAWLNTMPEQLERLRVVDPVGMFVWLTSQLVGDKHTLMSYDKSQSNLGFHEKLVAIKERASAHALLVRETETDSKRLMQVCVANEIMMKLLALSSFRGLYRQHRKLKPLFYSLSNCAKDLDGWGAWLKQASKTVNEFMVKGNSDDSDAGIERRASLQHGHQPMQRVVVRDLRYYKRQWLNKLGISIVVRNSLIDALTTEELELPNINEPAYDIQVLNDKQVKNRIHNRIIRKKHGRNTGQSKLGKSDRARKAMKKAVEVDNFLDLLDETDLDLNMGDIKPQKRA